MVWVTSSPDAVDERRLDVVDRRDVRPGQVDDGPQVGERRTAIVPSSGRCMAMAAPRVAICRISRVVDEGRVTVASGLVGDHPDELHLLEHVEGVVARGPVGGQDRRRSTPTGAQARAESSVPDTSLALHTGQWAHLHVTCSAVVSGHVAGGRAAMQCAAVTSDREEPIRIQATPPTCTP